MRSLIRVIFTLVSPLLPTIGATGAAAAAAGAALGGEVGALAAAGAALAAAAGAGVGAAAATLTGAAAAAGAGASSPVEGSMTNNGSPTFISSPSRENVSMIRPAHGLRTSTVTCVCVGNGRIERRRAVREL
jgi:hypothetical protein